MNSLAHVEDFFSRINKRVIWGVLKSVTGMQVKNLKSSHFTRRKHKGELSQPAILISATLMEYKVENLIRFLYNFSNTTMMVVAMDLSPPLRDCSVLNVVKPNLLYFELL